MDTERWAYNLTMRHNNQDSKGTVKWKQHIRKVTKKKWLTSKCENRDEGTVEDRKNRETQKWVIHHEFSFICGIYPKIPWCCNKWCKQRSTSEKFILVSLKELRKCLLNVLNVFVTLLRVCFCLVRFVGGKKLTWDTELNAMKATRQPVMLGLLWVPQGHWTSSKLISCMCFWILFA